MKKLITIIILISLIGFGCGRYSKRKNIEKTFSFESSTTRHNHMTYRIYEIGFGGIIVNETLDSLKLEEYKTKK
jgi:hypothetical protein